MAVEFNPEDVSSGYNLSKINSNFAKVKEALADAVSRAGISPNQMMSDLDMNSNDLLNVNALEVDSLTVGGLNTAELIEALEQGDETVEEMELLAAQAASSAAEAAGYAEFVKNNWVLMGPFTGVGSENDYLLSVDPGSINNMYVNVDGVTQLVSDNSFSLVYTSGSPYIRINVPSGLLFEVRTSNAIPVGTPSDGSVTTTKIADNNVTTSKLPNDAVTYAKMQNVSATNTLLGRSTAGAGDPEEISKDTLRDQFFPVGSVIGSTTYTDTTYKSVTAVIPLDDTTPLISEGVEIISGTYTPKNATNKIRVRYSCQVGTDAPPKDAVFAVFANSNCVGARAHTIQSGVTESSGEFEFTANVTSAITISVRAGTGSNTLRFNGTSSRLLGGASAITMCIEEIKGN